MAELRLKREEVAKLINFYRKYECLWNSNSKCFKYLHIKNKAWMEIAEEFSTCMEEIKKKVRNLRNSYVAEKRKIENSKKSGAGSDDIYETNLFYFNELQFLDCTIVPRKSTNNANVEENISDAEEAVEKRTSNRDDRIPLDTSSENFFSDGSILEENLGSQSTPGQRSSTGTLPKRQQKRKKMHGTQECSSSCSSKEKYENALQQVLSAANQPEQDDMFSAFAKSIALQLKNLPMLNAVEAMQEVQTVLLNHTRKVLVPQETQVKGVRILSNRILRPAGSSTSSLDCFSVSTTPPSSYENKDILRAAMLNSNISDESGSDVI